MSCLNSSRTRLVLFVVVRGIKRVIVRVKALGVKMGCEEREGLNLTYAPYPSGKKKEPTSMDPNSSASGPIIEFQPKPYVFLHVHILREYLEFELRFNDSQTNFKWSLDRAIDDWVFMIFFVGKSLSIILESTHYLVPSFPVITIATQFSTPSHPYLLTHLGNDFLPHLPSLEIREGAIDKLIELWRKHIPLLGGYLTHSGDIDLRKAAILLRELGSVEDDIFRERRAVEERKRVARRRRKLEAKEAEAMRRERIEGRRPENVAASMANLPVFSVNMTEMERAQANLKTIEERRPWLAKGSSSAGGSSSTSNGVGNKEANKNAAALLRQQVLAATSSSGDDDNGDSTSTAAAAAIVGVKRKAVVNGDEEEVEVVVVEEESGTIKPVCVDNSSADVKETDATSVPLPVEGEIETIAAADALDVELPIEDLVDEVEEAAEEEEEEVEAEVSVVVPPPTKKARVDREQYDSEEEPADDVKLWENGWKQRYYKNKFSVSSDDKEFRRE